MVPVEKGISSNSMGFLAACLVLFHAGVALGQDPASRAESSGREAPQAPVDPDARDIRQEDLVASNDIHLGLILGPHIKLKSWDLHERAERGDTPSVLWPQVGLRVGTRFLSYLAIEAEVTYMTYAASVSEPQGKQNHALSYRAGGLAELFPAKALSPFFTAGFGMYHNVAGSNGVDVDMRTDYGFGVRYAVAPSWRLRLDARHVFTDGVGDFALGHLLEVQGSVEFLPWRPIADRDGDGIADHQDSCPLVSGVASLDGCPDRDGDGLVDSKDDCPEAAGLPADGGCPDSDGDSLLDSQDLCPEKPGTPELDGCPLPDSDGDSLLDADDLCPEAAEDFDGFQDEDGCPDLDNDQDNISDADDQCPNEPEDVNGVKDRDGCPEADQDGDGLVDAGDKCPNEPETFNTFADQDGCPDEEPEDVLAMDGEFASTLTFTAGEAGKQTLTQASVTALQPLVTLMKTYPLLRYDLTLYTPRSQDEQDSYFLAEQRLEAIRQHLLSKGIKSEHIRTTTGGMATEEATQAQRANGYLLLERF